MLRDWRIFLDDIATSCGKISPFGIDNDILWDIVCNKVPELNAQLKNYIQ